MDLISWLVKYAYGFILWQFVQAIMQLTETRRILFLKNVQSKQASRFRQVALIESLAESAIVGHALT